MNAVHAFVDGGYLREIARDAGVDFPNPRDIAHAVLHDSRLAPGANRDVWQITRVSYYDAASDDPDETDPELTAYWNAVEILRDTELRFGDLRAKSAKNPRRQKG